ncbi:PaaX family transcriptional regulator C-terminal domain-containing protein [Pseudonocardia sp. GCM10023141]|uniref:PaaX family transcriptional regulator n=1 Tax=Pseudonocardia sp. GCM10023141 TaxID=3252653 RepID=UPI00360D2125
MTVVEDPFGTAQAPSAVQPRQLIVTLYGLYARQHGGWLSVASVVRLMADLGVDEQAVRSSIYRLKRRDLLVAEKVGGAAGYRLSDVAQEILADGDARIFGRRRATVADGWLLVVFSVPESEREKRHQLRSELTHLGFGTVAPGVWVAPGHVETEANELIRRLRLTEYVELFRAQHVAFGDPQVNVRTWWDLDALRALYAAFLDVHRPVQQRWSAGEGGEPAATFAAYVEMLTAWRRLPYADPGLPLELLPADWNGLAAEELFTALRERFAGPADDHARAVLAAARR